MCAHLASRANKMVQSEAGESLWLRVSKNLTTRTVLTDILLPGQVPQKEIHTQTAAGNDIPNAQMLEVDESEIRKLPLLLNKYGPKLTQRTDPTGIYNCHGLVFASRRTFISEGNFLPQILEDDHYQDIPSSEVLAGDVILYFDDQSREVSHSGLVVETVETMPGVPLVCSKWGANAEFLHWANNTPYGMTWRFYRVRRRYD